MMSRLILRRSMSAVAGHGHGHGHGPVTTYGGVELRKVKYDDMPIPAGSWSADYNKKQAQKNTWLAVGTAFFAITLGYVWTKDPFDIEKVLGPYKFMKNPPAFESPVLEPNILLEYENSVNKIGLATAKK